MASPEVQKELRGAPRSGPVKTHEKYQKRRFLNFAIPIITVTINPTFSLLGQSSKKEPKKYPFGWLPRQLQLRLPPYAASVNNTFWFQKILFGGKKYAVVKKRNLNYSYSQNL